MEYRYREIADRLERCRLLLGWSGHQVARKLWPKTDKASTRYNGLITRWRQAQRKARPAAGTLEALVALFEARGFRREWLLFGRGDPGGPANASLVRKTLEESSPPLLLQPGPALDAELERRGSLVLANPKDPSPARAIAAGIARLVPFDGRAIGEVCARPVPTPDLGQREWLNEMRLRDLELSAGEHTLRRGSARGRAKQRR